MSKFQPGDSVRRINYPNKGAKLHCHYTVHSCDDDGMLYLNEVLGTYHTANFELDKPLPRTDLTNRALTAVGVAPEVYNSTATGRKDDSGKLDMTLFDDMPRALEAVAEVMQWAITKKLPVPYERGSWQGVSADRYRAAIKRHDLAATKQATAAGYQTTEPAPRFERDAETNLLHLAHQACSALFALELTLREMESQ